MKLNIKKQTVANLEAKEMESAKGGILLTITPTICEDLCIPAEFELDNQR